MTYGIRIDHQLMDSGVRWIDAKSETAAVSRVIRNAFPDRNVSPLVKEILDQRRYEVVNKGVNKLKPEIVDDIDTALSPEEQRKQSIEDREHRLRESGEEDFDIDKLTGTVKAALGTGEGGR